ncbi:MAG TPA: glutaminyl-peptide cyclotransferase, partial [Thermomicrobiales bacterium]|nr:glutaminyl-peptide cyclotransferase [Thermomicrobiales bacterium]
ITIIALIITASLLLAGCKDQNGSIGSPIPTATKPAATQSASPLASGVATEPPTVTATAFATGTATATTSASPTEPVAQGEPPVYGYRIVNSYPHDPAAFTQGLDIDDGALFEGTGLNGESSLRRVNLTTGEVLQQVNLPEEFFGEGIVVFGERIYQITWQSQTAFVYDRETFEQLETHSYPTEGWGLTTDGERLIMSDGSSTIFFRDPETFAESRHIDVHDGEDPVVRLNELEWVNGEIWANVWQTDLIARIDPATGAVVGWIDLTGLLQPEDQAGHKVDVLNGIAVDEATGKLYVTGKLWPALYEIELVAP